jgi:hypothetical protein
MEAWQRGALDRLEQLVREEKELNVKYKAVRDRLYNVSSRVETTKAFIKGELDESPDDKDFKEEFERILSVEEEDLPTPVTTVAAPQNNGKKETEPTEAFSLQAAEVGSNNESDGEEGEGKTDIFLDILQKHGQSGLTFAEIETHLPSYNVEISRGYLHTIKSKQQKKGFVTKVGNKILLTEKGKQAKVNIRNK